MDVQLDNLIANSLYEFYLGDAETYQLIYANQTALDNLGYTLEEITRLRIHDFNAGITAEMLDQTFAPMFTPNGPGKVVVSSIHTRSDGSTYPVDMHIQLMEMNGRQVLFGFSVIDSLHYEELEGLRQVIKTAGIGYWDFDHIKDRYFFDENCLGMLGLKEGELKMENPDAWLALIHPNDFPLLREQIQKASSNGGTFISDFRVRHKSGDWKWMQSIGTIQGWDEANKLPVKMTGLHLDISQNKKDVLEKEQFYRLFNISTDIMVIGDAAANLFKVNPATLNVLGYTEEELIGRCINDFLHEEDREASAREIEHQIATGYTRDFENRMIAKDGSYHWLSWTCYHDKTEGITYAFARDLTKRKRVEEELRQKEDIYQALVTNSSDSIVLLDREHRTLYANPMLEKVMQQPLEAMVGKTTREQGFSEALCSMWEETVNEVFNTGRGQSTHFNLDEDFDNRVINWNVFPGGRDANGNVSSVFGVARDVTLQQRAAQELQKMERLNSIGILAGGIAHDFNNILTIMFGNIAMAKNQVQNPRLCLETL